MNELAGCINEVGVILHSSRLSSIFCTKPSPLSLLVSITSSVSPGRVVLMGRRRVLVLAPAITRMQCMDNPYKRVKNAGSRGREEEPGTEEVIKRKGSTSFWSLWRKRKAPVRNKTKRRNVGKGGEGRSRSWGFRMTSKLTIRILSPGYWVKKLRDSYINLMLALERNAPSECSGMVTYPAHTVQQRFSGGTPAGGAYVMPTFAPLVFF